MLAGNDNPSVFIVNTFLNKQEGIMLGKDILFCSKVPGGRMGEKPVTGRHFLIAGFFQKAKQLIGIVQVNMLLGNTFDRQEA